MNFGVKLKDLTSIEFRPLKTKLAEAAMHHLVFILVS
uniref:Uncharacterized protein n=1 Tax=Cyanothece sp. (strain PCC 7425 / ATCC 29141) TaxID=395961 RepID=B8HKG1_CYAP4